MIYNITMDNIQKFEKAIRDKKLILMVKDTKEKGVIKRKCVPYDFAPGKTHKDKNLKYYWTWHTETKHPSNALPKNVKEIQILEDETFEPRDYIHWDPPYNWNVSRDWGEYS